MSRMTSCANLESADEDAEAEKYDEKGEDEGAHHRGWVETSSV